MKSLKILWLRERFNWMGKHSGYDQVCDAIAKQHPDTYLNVWRELGKPLPRGSRYYLPKLMAGTKPSPFYNLYSASAESKVLWKSFLEKPELVHVTYVENNLGILPKWKKRLSFKLIGTLHQPASWWRLIHPHPEIISILDAVVVCASKEVTYFEKYLPGRVFFVPHGIDTNFFYPQWEIKQSSAYPRCIFSGRWLRDTQTLAQVIERVLAQNPEIQFDMIVPQNSRDDSSFFRIARHPQVAWYSGISDGHLRKLYQQAAMLFLPLLDCTANNAILEAMACGLPIISNQVGGLPDYTRDTFAELFPVGDVEGMSNAILSLAENLQAQKERGQAARLFAEENFSWGKIANQTLAIYEKVVKS